MEKGNRLEELELAVDFQKDEQALCRFIQKHIQEQIQQQIQERSNNNLPSQRFILIADQFEELYTLTLKIIAQCCQISTKFLFSIHIKG